MRVLPCTQLSLVFASLVCACGGGGGGGGDDHGAGPGLAPLVRPQTLVGPVSFGSAVQGFAALEFTAPGRGLLFGDESVMVAFDENGVLRRAFGLSDTALVQSAVSSGGARYLTTFDFAGPEGDLLVRLDATASTQSSWALPASSYLVPDGAGRAYLAIASSLARGRALQGLGLDSIARLASDGSLSWTVDAAAPMTFIDVQEDGLLVGLTPGIGAQGLFTSAVLARVGPAGDVPWQLNFDGAESGAILQEAWATGVGGAWATWAQAGPFAQAGVEVSGICLVQSNGDVEAFANPIMEEMLDEYERPYLDDDGLDQPFHSDRRAFLARGSAGGAFHIRPASGGLDVDRLEFESEACTSVESKQEPVNGELLADVQTTAGRHLVRWRKDGSVRWAKRIDGFSGLGAWRGLPGGGALVVLGPPTGAPVGVVSCVASIGSDGNTLWVRDAIGLSTVGGHDMLITADGGAALWWGGRLMLVGAQGEFRSQRKLESPDGDIAAVVAKRSSGVVVAVRSPGLGGITFWSTDFLGANASTSCIMNIDTDLLAGVAVPNSITLASSGLVAPSPSVFTVTTVAELAAVPVVQLARSRPIAGVDLGTTTPSCP